VDESILFEGKLLLASRAAATAESSDLVLQDASLGWGASAEYVEESKGRKTVLESGYSNTLLSHESHTDRTWLKETSRQTGVPMGRVIHEQLESARTNGREAAISARHRGAQWAARPLVL